jgi:hypothetical protein
VSASSVSVWLAPLLNNSYALMMQLRNCSFACILTGYTAAAACLSPTLLSILRSEHDTLTDDDIAVYNTPEGMLASDVVPEGVYVPEVVVSKNVRKARGRMRVRRTHRMQLLTASAIRWGLIPKPLNPAMAAAVAAAVGQQHSSFLFSLLKGMTWIPCSCRNLLGRCNKPERNSAAASLAPSTQQRLSCTKRHDTCLPHAFLCGVQSDNRAFASADDDEDDDEPAPPPKAAVPTRPSAAAAGRGGGRAGPAAAAGKGPKDAAARQAEFRAKKLQEEAEVGRPAGDEWAGLHPQQRAGLCVHSLSHWQAVDLQQRCFLVYR